MFYESLYQIIMLVLIIITGIFTLCLYMYQAKKAMEYNNDERWQSIQAQADKAAVWYYNALTALVCIGSFAIFSFGIEMNISLERVFRYAIIALLMRNAVEFLALRYFDKTL